MPRLRYFKTFERLERGEIIPPAKPLTLYREVSGLSPARPQGLKSSKYAISLAVKDRNTDGPKAALTAAALPEIKRRLASFGERDFADASSRNEYRRLRQAQFTLEASRQNVVSQTKVSKPPRIDWPLTKYGTAARYSGFTSVAGRPLFRGRQLLDPCIERYVRKQVLFAIGKGGKGFRTPHRRNSNSWIPC